MAILPTGSASLRTSRPRAAQLAPNQFETDVESVGRAITMHGRTNDMLGQLDTRRRERQIGAETFDDRLATAQIEAAGTRARAPGAQDILRDAQILEGQTAGRNLDRFDAETEALEIEDLQRISAAKRAAAQEALDLEAEELSRTEILQAKQQAFANAVTEEQRLGVQGQEDLMRAEGTEGERIIRDDTGEFVEDFVTTPTQEDVVLGRKQTMTPQDIAEEERKMQLEEQKAESYAAQIEAQTGRKVRVNVIKNENAITRRTESITTIVTDQQTGEEIAVRTTPLSRTVATATNDPILDSLPGPATPGNLPSTTAPGESVEERGMVFIPTGPAAEGMERGGVYTTENGTRVLYTGGDPNDPKNRQPL